MNTTDILRESKSQFVRREFRGAGACYYAGQLRLRTLVTVDASDKELVQSLSAVHDALGRPLTDWLGGDVRDWVAAIEGALKWDRENAFPELYQFAIDRGKSYEDAELAYAATKEALVAFRRSVITRRAEVYAARRTLGLPLRDPGAVREIGTEPIAA